MQAQYPLLVRFCKRKTVEVYVYQGYTLDSKGPLYWQCGLYDAGISGKHLCVSSLPAWDDIYFFYYLTIPICSWQHNKHIFIHWDTFKCYFLLQHCISLFSFIFVRTSVRYTLNSSSDFKCRWLPFFVRTCSKLSPPWGFNCSSNMIDWQFSWCCYFESLGQSKNKKKLQRSR